MPNFAIHAIAKTHTAAGPAKIRQYCAYQERAHSEVKGKLYEYGLNRAEVEEAVSQLIQENYLNEERFAIQFAGGKFRMKKWGRTKIRYELKMRQVSEFCIRKALASIDEDAYEQTLQDLFEEKKRLLKSERNIFIRKKKIQSHLLQKGYETDRINALLATL